MDWCQEILDQLAKRPVCGYQAEQAAATEPTALAALALLASGRAEASLPALRWLARLQADDGSVGVREHEPSPGWPTSLAVLAWSNANGGGEANAWSENIHRGLTWCLDMKGETQARTADVGHDPALVAWPWVEGTHAWIEPTALHVLALKAAGRTEHPRAREAVRMLIDRQLPSGGCNYGNTFMLGQKLRPHIQPTGLAMLALVGESDERGRILRSLNYLQVVLTASTTPLSLSWGLLGLAAHQRLPKESSQWLSASAMRLRRRPFSPHPAASLCLAALQCREPARPVLTKVVPYRPHSG